eukprot:CAMPEP_0179014368 /NCGR_PEP_ID=MMETSP0796-20121207/2217_1 /TAXON_ID=73915 /ORGANISM="Pyrodinium bahamense, Strain pbaha01" /LENGTH=147 /DNA_ID=CAMNT_0020709923 /DNA_START=74 /DNA_END=516 /DNA_ORIENTATION=-
MAHVSSVMGSASPPTNQLYFGRDVTHDVQQATEEHPTDERQHVTDTQHRKVRRITCCGDEAAALPSSFQNGPAIGPCVWERRKVQEQVKLRGFELRKFPPVLFYVVDPPVNMSRIKPVHLAGSSCHERGACIPQELYSVTADTSSCT